MANKVLDYRPDIDGLRAIAVISVIIFHISPSVLPGGYVGVDVFFVISGYLITSIIYKEVELNKFTFIGFYSRRIKRILPPLLAVLFITLVIGVFFLLPSDLNNLAKSLFATNFYVSNMWFLFQDNYFTLGASEFPLLHTWSLSVEEQYYLLWPLILVVCRRRANLSLFVASLFLCLSLFIAIYYTNYHLNSDGYYLIFSRAYELMIGSILALMLSSNLKISIINEKYRQYIGHIYSFCGTICIGYSIFFYTSLTLFPGYAALLPTLGAALIILAGNIYQNSCINRILRLNLFVFIGLISYSLYLWHWPILAFYHYFFINTNLNFVKIIILVLLILITSVLSYFFIEKPVKKLKLSNLAIIIYIWLIPSLVILISCGYIILNSGVESRLNDITKTESLFLSDPYCWNGDAVKQSCIISKLKNNSSPKILLFGDSHAGMYSPFWGEIAEKYGFNIKELNVASCYPLINVNNSLPSDDPNIWLPDLCEKQIKYVTNNYSNFDIIIVSGAYANYLPNGARAPQKFKFADEFKKTINLFLKSNKTVIIMEEPPKAKDDSISKMIRQSMLPKFLQAPSKIEMDDNMEINKYIESIVGQHDNLYYLNINQMLIDENKFYPYVGDKNIVAYMDAAHFNLYGAEFIGKQFVHSKESIPLKKVLIVKKIINN
ncbi:MAG: acyltransferase [Sphingobacteriaceae bacterium]|nr:acyltransferase [Sphingobacteriaceae bacterium]